jgi:D-serine deaminase-like pyridoxal phosphate-dependent protein
MDYRELSTPALTIDLDVMERNLDRMAAYCRAHGLGLRPHVKTHKTVEVARMQLERGALGLTVAKVGEAEVMIASGIVAETDEVLIAYPILGGEKARRLATLARTSRILVSLDSPEAAKGLSHVACEEGVKFGVLVEFDSGFGRCGLGTGSDCVALARTIEKLPHLSFRGLMTYFGNVWGSEEQRSKEMRHSAERIEKVLDCFASERIKVEVVSGGSTPSHQLSHTVPGLTEIRPGTYVYSDLNTFYQGVCTLEDCAARVVTTVISTAVQNRAMIDAGSKTLSSDLLNSGPRSGYGYVLDHPDAKLLKLNEEHGHLDITDSSHRFKVGDVLTVIPNHVCTCVNMHDEVFLVRNQEVVGCWRVAARGKIR